MVSALSSELGQSRQAKHATTRVAGFSDLPKELVANIVSSLPYADRPAFRATCKLACELVDAASNGWVMKVDEGEALLTSGLLQRLTSLAYMWFERWTWEGDQEANFLAVMLINRNVFAKLQEVRFPRTPHIPFRCLRGLLSALLSVVCLSLPPLAPVVLRDSPLQHAALRSIAALTSVVELNMEGWEVTDSGARILGQGLPKLQRLILGDLTELSRTGYSSLAQLRGLQCFTATGVRGNNLTLEPLTALTGLTGLRMELALGFRDEGLGPLACLPALRTLGWWHAEAHVSTGLRPGSVSPWLRELSLCVELDMRALSVLAATCTGLAMMQVQGIVIPSPEEDPAFAAAAVAAGVAVITPANAQAVASGSGAAAARTGTVVPVMPSLRTLIIGELYIAPLDELQPVVRLRALFPALENVLVFHVLQRGMLLLEGLSRLKRLVFNCISLRDELLGLLPPLPSLKGLQLECCSHLTGAAVGALRAVPSVEQLLLIDTPAVTDSFLTEAVVHLRGIRTLILSRLPNVRDEGLQALAVLASSLEHLELRFMPEVTPAGLQVVLQLPRLNLVTVSECAGIGKDACRDLGAALVAAGRDVVVEHETTVLVSVSLADEFGASEEAEDLGARR
ncbi:hypothetical protein Vafri_7378 [Volvox africanus]|uniref:F-box domain-containing protein n=1 Tax=Volvox africanus TaxID=51714 RepID=A0A8J4B037_9CHLO|nr:hypothetical protein Vafri_7378 [Volvox africanus]